MNGEHRRPAHQVPAALLEYETLSGDEVEAILNGQEIDRSEASGSPGDSGRRSSVPSSGKPAKGPGKSGTGGMEPEPQPGG